MIYDSFKNDATYNIFVYKSYIFVYLFVSLFGFMTYQPF